MQTFFYISGIVLWIGIVLMVLFYLALYLIALSIPNEKDLLDDNY